MFSKHENLTVVLQAVADASAELTAADAYFEHAVERIEDFGDVDSDAEAAEDFGNFDANPDENLLLAVATDRLSSLVCLDSDIYKSEKDED